MFDFAQYQFAPPPEPAFRPEPTWRGRDYYNAAAMSPDPYVPQLRFHAPLLIGSPSSIYDNTWDRVSAPGASTLGVGFHEARHWHRRAYGGLVSHLPPYLSMFLTY
jgi:hypothetical protein